MEYLEKQANPLQLSISSIPYSLGFGSNLTNMIQFFTEKNNYNLLFSFDYLHGRLLSFFNYLYEQLKNSLEFFSFYKFGFYFNFVMRSGHL